MLIFLSFKHVHSFIVDIRSGIDDIDTMLNAHLNRVTGSGMSTKSLAKSVGFIYTSCCLLVGEVAVLC